MYDEKELTKTFTCLSSKFSLIDSNNKNEFKF